MPEGRLRAAVPGDAPGLADAHVQAWQETYRGLLADGYLDRISRPKRLRLWRRVLASPQPGSAVFVVEDADGIAGFAMGGPQREAGRPAEAELYTLYLLRRRQREGWGRALFGAVATAAAAAGARSLETWVLDGNASAMAFYTAMGGARGERRSFRIARRLVHESAFVWPEIATLCGPAKPG